MIAIPILMAVNHKMEHGIYNRAGWCPGAIAQWFDYNMTPFVAEGDIEYGLCFL